MEQEYLFDKTEMATGLDLAIRKLNIWDSLQRKKGRGFGEDSLVYQFETIWAAGNGKQKRSYWEKVYLAHAVFVRRLASYGDHYNIYSNKQIGIYFPDFTYSWSNGDSSMLDVEIEAFDKSDNEVRNAELDRLGHDFRVHVLNNHLINVDQAHSIAVAHAEMFTATDLETGKPDWC